MNFLDPIEEQKDVPYLQRKEQQAEQLCLLHLNHGTLSDFIMLGMDSRIPDVDKALSIGNVEYILQTIYHCHSQYPHQHIHVAFENALIAMLDSGFYEFYAAMDTIYAQLKREAQGKAAFTIGNAAVFTALKEAIAKNKDHVFGKKYYAGQLFDNGLTGYVEQLNNLAKQKGYLVL